MIRMRTLIRCAVLGSLVVAALPVRAAVNVTVDPSQNWLGYMNVFELPENGGGYLWGSPWGPLDLSAKYTGDVASLAPNTSISRDVALSDRYWWKPDGTGNKQMNANFYVENSAELVGQEVTFSGNVLLNSLVSPYTARAFIKDFDPGYGLTSATYLDLVPGPFSFKLQTISAPGRHVQYGFELTGPNARLDQIQQLGMVQIGPAAPGVIPEPSTLALFATSAAGLLARRRRKG